MRIRAIFVLLTLTALLAVRPLPSAQIPGITMPTAATTGAAPATPALPPDPLGRENPRGCVLGFIRAAQDEKYPVAVEYFEPPARRVHYSEEDEEELAAQLLALFNHSIAGPLDFLSHDPAGRLDDGLPADREKVSSVLGSGQDLPIFLVRREDEQGRKLWYFARDTLQQVPRA